MYTKKTPILIKPQEYKLTILMLNINGLNFTIYGLKGKNLKISFLMRTHSKPKIKE